ncbi:MAG: tetratricopeptide repeat protein [Elusimicrobiota bacterium]|nr:tetratricopeptide repeat protein [Elusimicrobiota bacterium]
MKPATPSEYLDEAIKLSLRALELDQDNLLASTTLGLAYLKAGQSGDSIARLEKTLNSLPADADGLVELNLSLGQAYCHAGRTEEAQACFLKAVREKAPSALVFLLTGYCLLAQGEQEGAMKAFLRAAELDPRLANPHSVLACALALLGRYETAIEAFYQNTARNGPNAFDMCAVGACLYAAAGSGEKALTVLEEAALLQPQNITALDRAAAEEAAAGGIFFYLRDFYLRAARVNDKAALRDSRLGADLLILHVCGRIITKLAGKDSPLLTPHMLPHYLKCAIYFKQGLHDRNIECCRHILEADSGDPLAARLLQQSNAALGTPDKAVGFYKEVLTRNSRDIGAALRVIDMYLELGDMDLALVYCRKALDIEPQDLQANYNMGLILLRKERAYAALPYLQKAAELDSDNAVTLLALGEAQAQTRDFAAARSAWEKVAAADTHGEWGRQAREKLAALGAQREEASPPAAAVPPPEPAQTGHTGQGASNKQPAKDDAPEQGGA